MGDIPGLVSMPNHLEDEGVDGMPALDERRLQVPAVHERLDDGHVLSVG